MIWQQNFIPVSRVVLQIQHFLIHVWTEYWKRIGSMLATYLLQRRPKSPIHRRETSPRIPCNSSQNPSKQTPMTAPSKSMSDSSSVQKSRAFVFFLTCWMSSWTFWVDSGLTYGNMFAFPPNTARPSHVSVFARRSFCTPRRKWLSLPALAWIPSLHHANMWHIFFVNTLTCLLLSLKCSRETLRCCLVAQAAMTFYCD